MTVRTQDGKVNTIGGKVSCTCCPEPKCCVYPATGASSFYPDTDLPDAVTINWPGHFQGSASRSGRGYSAGTVSLAINSAQTLWVLTDSLSSRSVGACLLREAGGLVIDQFAAEYNFYDGSYSDNYTLSRVGVCSWEIFFHARDYTEPYTPEREGALAYALLEYTDFITPGRPLWWLDSYRLFGPFFDPVSGTDILYVDRASRGDKTGDQNRPDGTYTGDITIS